MTQRPNVTWKWHSVHTFDHIFQEEELINECMSPSTAGVNSFKLHDRAKHVYSEASRVLKFKKVCEEKPANAVQVGKFLKLGNEL